MVLRHDLYGCGSGDQRVLGIGVDMVGSRRVRPHRHGMAHLPVRLPQRAGRGAALHTEARDGAGAVLRVPLPELSHQVALSQIPQVEDCGERQAQLHSRQQRHRNLLLGPIRHHRCEDAQDSVYSRVGYLGRLGNGCRLRHEGLA